LDPEWRRRRLAFRPEDEQVSLLQFVAAGLVIVGSALVLGAVWLADLEGQMPQSRADEATPAEWREAA
jgi:hypothetical protein